MPSYVKEDLTLELLIRRSLYIVVAEFGKKLDSEVVRYDKDSCVETLVRMNVLDHVKGEDQPKGLTLRIIGGHVGDRTTEFIYELRRGQPYLLALAKDTGSGRRKIYVPIHGMCMAIDAKLWVPVIPDLHKELRKHGLSVQKGKTEWQPLRKLIESKC